MNYVRFHRTAFDRMGWFLFNSLPIELYNKLCERQAYLCGGALTSVFSGKPIKDFDFFFINREDRMAMRKVCTSYFKIITFASENATTFRNDEICVQLCKKPEGKIEDILDKFDFTIVQAGYDFKTHEFVLHKKFLYHLSILNLSFLKKVRGKIIFKKPILLIPGLALVNGR